MKKILSILLILVLCFSFSGCGSNTGKIIEDKPFYSLQAAYNQGFITKKDLKNISAMYKKDNNGSIGEQLAKKIKSEYLTCYFQNENKEVKIDKYLGTYSNCVAVMISCVCEQYISVCWTEIIAGIEFEYSNSQRILIWKE